MKLLKSKNRTLASNYRQFKTTILIFVKWTHINIFKMKINPRTASWFKFKNYQLIWSTNNLKDQFKVYIFLRNNLNLIAPKKLLLYNKMNKTINSIIIWVWWTLKMNIFFLVRNQCLQLRFKINIISKKPHLEIIILFNNYINSKMQLSRISIVILKEVQLIIQDARLRLVLFRITKLLLISSR